MYNDLIGKKFGRLTIIEIKNKPDDYKSKGKYCLCKCDCGNEKIIRKHDVIHGNTISCGCYHREINSPDLLGQCFGELIVIKQNNTDKHGNIMWLCRCNCGNEAVVRATRLRNGKTKSCGCLGAIKFKGYGESSKNTIFSRYKKRAEKKNVEFSLSKDRFFELTDGVCFYCGEKPSNVNKNKNNNGDFIYNGIDRIDSSKGYIEGNVVTSCSKCNFAKREMTTSEFYEWIDKIYEYRRKQFTD